MEKNKRLSNKESLLFLWRFKVCRYRHTLSRTFWDFSVRKGVFEVYVREELVRLLSIVSLLTGFLEILFEGESGEAGIR